MPSVIGKSEMWTSGRRTRHLGSSLIAVLWAFLYATPAEGFCTLRDCEDDEQTGQYCEREHGCITEGIALYPRSACFQFAIAEGHGELVGLSDWELEAIIQRAFQRWQSVDCGGGRRPGFKVQSAGVVPIDHSFACNFRHLNMDVWLFKSEWDRAPRALGFTVSTHAVGDGEVFDADVELNLTRLAAEVPDGHLEAALLSVATHEAGHVLGLSHSNDQSAVMASDYGTPQDVRALTADDVRGVCSLFPKAPNDLTCPAPMVVTEAFDPVACSERSRLEPTSASTCTLGRIPARRREPGVYYLCVVCLWLWVVRRSVPF